MPKKVELPIKEPLYSTYHNLANTTAIITENPSVENWYLNFAVNLRCSKKFLSGFTTPEITILNAAWYDDVTCFEKSWLPSRFVMGYINPIIKRMLNQGFYVVFDSVDDYYIKGKTWYKQRHFSHDGLICGYNKEDKTYCIYAYDSNWVYRKFWTPQKCFDEGREAMYKKGTYPVFCALKPKKDNFEFYPQAVTANLKNYLDSNMEKYPLSGGGDVYGIAVHEYMAIYLDKLLDGSIPYDRMDWRIFRLIWEHKKGMLKRIRLLEQHLGIDKEFGDKYEKLVADADKMRLLYASHKLKRRDSFLKVIKELLLKMNDNEREILNKVINESEKRM